MRCLRRVEETFLDERINPVMLQAHVAETSSPICAGQLFSIRSQGRTEHTKAFYILPGGGQAIVSQDNKLISSVYQASSNTKDNGALPTIR